MGLLDLLFGKREMDVSGSINNGDNIQKEHKNIQNTSSEFVFEIEDVFNITGRGTVVTGHVLKGSLKVGEEVTIAETGQTTVVTGIEMFRKMLDEVKEGENAGLLLSGVDRSDVERGYTLTK